MAKEYIEREEALNICDKYYQHCLEMYDFNGDSIADGISEDIKALPAADVVEVVRCEKCCHLEKKKMICLHPGNRVFNTGKPTYSNHFCSYGDRKDGSDMVGAG